MIQPDDNYFWVGTGLWNPVKSDTVYLVTAVKVRGSGYEIEFLVSELIIDESFESSEGSIWRFCSEFTALKLSEKALDDYHPIRQNERKRALFCDSLVWHQETIFGGL